VARVRGKQPAQVKDIAKLLADGREIDRAMKRAAADAVKRHFRAGNPIAVDRGGKVVWIQPKNLAGSTRRVRRVER